MSTVAGAPAAAKSFADTVRAQREDGDEGPPAAAAAAADEPPAARDDDEAKKQSDASEEDDDADPLAKDGAITKACEEGNVDVVKLYLDRGNNINDFVESPHGKKTPLQIACHKGKTDLVRFLLDRGAEVNKYSEKQWVALALAGHNVEIVTALLDAGADAFLKVDKKHDTLALLSMCDNDFTTMETFRAAIEHPSVKPKADVFAEIDGSGWGFIHRAAHSGCVPLVKYAIEDLGVPVDQKQTNRAAWSALHFAVRHNHKDLVEYLLDKGADVTIASKDHKRTPFSLCGLNPEIATRLLDIEAVDVLAPTYAEGQTCAAVAACSNSYTTHETACAILRHPRIADHHLNKFRSFDEKGFAAVHRAANGGTVGGLRAIVEILEVDVDFLQDNDFNWTAMHFASRNDAAECVKYLLEHGAKVDVPSKTYFRTAFSLCGGSAEVVKLLLDAGADPLIQIGANQATLAVNAVLENDFCTKEAAEAMLKHERILEIRDRFAGPDPSGWAAVHRVASSGNPGVMEAYLDAYPEVDINLRQATNMAWTPLHFAARNGHVKMAQCLLERDAHVDAPSATHNRTPLSLCGANPKLAVALLDAGANVLAPSYQAGNVHTLFAMLENDFCTAKTVKAILNHESVKPLWPQLRKVDGSAWGAIHRAANSGVGSVVRVLVQELGVDINMKQENNIGWTALHFGTRNDKPEVVKALIDLKAEIDPVTRKNNTPLATCGQNPEVLRMVLDAGADPAKLVFQSKNVPAMVAICENSYTTFACMEALINHPRVTVNRFLFATAAPTGFGAIHRAAQNGTAMTIRALVSFGVSPIDLPQDNDWGWTALHFAVRQDKADAVEELVARAATIDMPAKRGRRTAFSLCGISPTPAEMLLDAGADIFLGMEDGNRVWAINTIFWNDYVTFRTLRAILEHPRVKPHHAVLRGVDASGWGALHRAAGSGSGDAVRACIEILKCDINLRQSNGIGWTALHFGTRNNKPEVVQLLIEFGCDIDPVTDKNNTPLATCGHNPDIMRMVLDAGADPLKMVYSNANVPAMTAVFENSYADLETLTVMLQHRRIAEHIDVLQRCDESGFAAIHRAAQSGTLDGVKALVELANVNVDLPQTNAFGWTSLHFAARHAKPGTVQYLLSKNATVDEPSRTHNRTALSLGGSDAEVIKLLLDAGADPFQPVYQSKNVYAFFAMLENEFCTAEAVKALINHPSLADKKDKLRGVDDSGWGAIHRAANSGVGSVVKVLVQELGVDINMKQANNIGWTALHFGTRNDKPEVVKELIALKPDLEARTAKNNTPLATCGHNADIMKMMLDAGADPMTKVFQKKNVPALNAICENSYSNWDTLSVMLAHEAVKPHLKTLRQCDDSSFAAIHRAAQSGSLDTMKALIEVAECPVDLLQTNDYKWTALHFAARHGRPDIVEFLLGHGAKVDIPAAKGARTAFSLCGNNANVATMLLDRGADIFAGIEDGERVWAVFGVLWNDYVARSTLKAIFGHSAVQPHMDKLRDEADGSGWAAIHRAVDSEALDAVEACVEDLRCDVHRKQTNDSGWTPLHFAARNGNSDIVQYLLKNGARVEDKTGNNNSTLVMAAGSSACVNLLLGAGADPLQPCLRSGDVPAVLALLEMTFADYEGVKAALTHERVQAHRKDVLEGHDSHGFGALDRAANGGSVGAAKAVLEVLELDVNRRQANGNGWTALHQAARYSNTGTPELVSLLLDKGATVDLHTLRHFRTPLSLCGLCPAVAPCLLSAGADPLAQVHESRKVWSVFAMLENSQTTAATAQAFLKHDKCKAVMEQLKGLDPSGMGALHRAVLGGNVAIVRVVAETIHPPLDMATGRDTADKELANLTALALAKKKDLPQIVSFLSFRSGGQKKIAKQQ